MKFFTIQGQKNGLPHKINCSQLVMGSGDFLRLDNFEFAASILDRFIELGGTTFDTAFHYRHSEKALGKWIESRNIRDQVTILTKGCHPTREFPTQPRVNPQAIYEDLMGSLERLQTDYVDLYALHRDDPTVPVGELLEALNQWIEKGTIRAIGASNWKLDRIIEANQYAAQHQLIPFTFTSPNLSLAKCNRPRWEGCVSADQTMIQWHKQNQVPLLSWSSQAGGFFSGRFTPEDHSNQEMVEVYYNDDNWERFARAKQLAEQKQVTPIQIALAYVLNQPFATAALIGPENADELISSFEGAQLKLTEKEVAWLDLQKII
ncbi:Predicted oxidoreductase [Seinonella peptonophila]|uniref:Predicted oxidoreductase n=1 Tax=Seinonella peptonophila TaxID=112248 RepID=A0A1M5A8F5_9BACL|nr:aldo/keto reductase [Seinonella peptonophila]SHF26435.1 Predicted oxidoreductase [Seinonella peptonophila]